MSDSIANPIVIGYTESKLVFFNRVNYEKNSSSKEHMLAEYSYTYDEINAEINDYIKDGWTPVNMSSGSGYLVSILFCR